MNKGSNRIGLSQQVATGLLFLSMYFSNTAETLGQAGTFQWNNPTPGTSKIIVDDNTTPAAAPIIHSTDINITGGDPDNIFTTGIQKAIDALAGKGNTDIKNKIPSDLVTKIGTELASYIDSNFPELKDKFPASKISLTEGIISQINIEFMVGKAKKVITIRIMGTKISPVITISSAGKGDKQVQFNKIIPSTPTYATAPSAYNSTENLVINPNSKIHKVAKGEYLQRDILPRMGFSNGGFMRIAGIGIDSVYGSGNMQIGTTIQLMDGSSEASGDARDGKWIFNVSGLDIYGVMINKTVTIIGKTKKVTVGKKTTNKLVFTYEIVDNNSSVALRPITHNTQLSTIIGTGNENLGQVILQIPTYTFKKGSKLGITEALKSSTFNGKINPVLASRSGIALQNALNKANNTEKDTAISDGNTLEHNPNAKTIILKSHGFIITLTYEGDLVTNISTQSENLSPVAYEHTGGGKVAVADNAVEFDAEGKAKIGKNGIGYSLKARLAKDGNGSINSEVIGTDAAEFIDQDLKTRIFAKGGSLQAGSKVSTQWEFRDTVNVSIEYKKPIMNGKKLTGYEKKVSTSTYKITVDGSGNIVSIVFVK